jgi:hypothetical protein
MGYLDDINPFFRKELERRKLSLHERPRKLNDPLARLVRSDFIDVYWDDGGKYAPDDRGLPVGVLTAYGNGEWGVLVDKPVQREVARTPDINDAIAALLLSLLSRYS